MSVTQLSLAKILRQPVTLEVEDGDPILYLILKYDHFTAPSSSLRMHFHSGYALRS